MIMISWPARWPSMIDRREGSVIIVQYKYLGLELGLISSSIEFSPSLTNSCGFGTTQGTVSHQDTPSDPKIPTIVKLHTP